VNRCLRRDIPEGKAAIIAVDLIAGISPRRMRAKIVSSTMALGSLEKGMRRTGHWIPEPFQP